MSNIEFQQLTELFQETHEHLGQIAARSINISLVVRNWLYGWYIVEFENAAAERAELVSHYYKTWQERLQIAG